MTLSATQRKSNPDQPVWWFLLCWTLFNAAQAFRLEIHADEAYYWMYSRFLDWGYFDHPPMVALFIRAGDSLMHNELGLRLMTILSSTLALYLLWLILKKYAVDAKLFVLVVCGTFIFHIYGFITTPDAPLFFFTVLFYYLYQKYTEKDSSLTALLFGVVVACALYSKYHAVLLIGFTLLSDLKLLKRGSFWLIVVVALALYVPHILWQVQHHYPSINYHLYDRSAAKYIPDNSFLYIPGQLLMAGPIIGWLFFYRAYKAKAEDMFMRCLRFNAIGTFIFFFLSTFRGEAQPHWTLIAFAPLVMLTLIQFKQLGNQPPRWFYRLAVANIAFILFLRVSLMFNIPPISRIGEIKSFYQFRQWAKEVKAVAGDHYVIMSDGFQDPSKYNYYTNSAKAYSYDSRYYRLTQYDLWPIEDRFQGQKVLYLQDGPTTSTFDTIKTKNRKWYAEWVDSMRTYQKIAIETTHYKVKSAPGAQLSFALKITNPYPYAVNFSNAGQSHEAVLEACFFKGDEIKDTQRDNGGFNQLSLQPNQTSAYNFTVKAPTEKGNYDLLFSIRTPPFGGGKNSRVIHLTVE